MAREERSAGFVIFSGPAQSRGENNAPRTEREYLLLDYGRHWDFAKGHLEKGEDDFQAACRELEEETGLREPAVIPGFCREIAYFFRHRKRGLVHKRVVFFLGETQTRKISLSPEHVGFQFLPFAAAMQRLTFATARDVLQYAEEYLRETGQ